jgi:predicted dehydrogenase
MRKIKVAQIGVQHDHANVTYRSITHLSDVFEVVGIAVEPDEDSRPNPVAVNGIKDKLYDGHNLMTVEEIFNIPDLDAVIIETNEISSVKYAIMAAERGIAVHLDKPGGIKLADFERLVETVKKNNVPFHLGYMYRYNPAVIQAHKVVNSGEIGEIISVEAQMNCHHNAEKRQWLSSFPGGMMFFLGCHLIDLIYQIQGEPDEVIPLSTSTGIDGLDSEDLGMAVFKYKDGVSFAKACDDERGGYSRRQLVICGEKGTIEIRPLEMVYKNSGQYTVSRENYSDSWLEPWEESQSEVFDRYDGMMRNFAEMVRGKENPYGYDYELNLYKLVLRACRGIK